MLVKNEIDFKEINGKEINYIVEKDKPKLIVKSHWNYPDRIHLVIESNDYLVMSKDLIKAIVNAENH